MVCQAGGYEDMIEKKGPAERRERWCWLETSMCVAAQKEEWDVPM